MARDPRASRLDDDPFDRIGSTSQKPPSVRVVVSSSGGSPFEPFLRGFFDVGQPTQLQRHDGSLFHFSKIELNDLAKATLAFGLAIAIVRHGGLWGMMSMPTASLVVTLPWLTFLSLLALAPAFIIHELAHKFVAKHYGCWAEFRADTRGLKMGLLLALLLGFVFMAPGAVMVVGRVSPKQNGIIAVAGPISNVLLFVIGAIGGGLLITTFGTNPSLVGVIHFWLFGNAILGAFNMLPFGPLDGRKVKDWSQPVFWGMLALTLWLTYSAFTYSGAWELFTAFGGV